LQNTDGFVQTCGTTFNSAILRVDPIARHSYQQLDYRPLVNARVHQLGRQRHILNDRFHQQYNALLTILGYQRELSADDLMAVTYYLLLQDRVAEAMDFFERVNSKELKTRLQYDYLAAYMSLYRADTTAAKSRT